MLSVWQNIFGYYRVLTNSDTGEELNSIAGVDFEYILLVVFFILCFHWLMKFLFSLFKDK